MVPSPVLFSFSSKAGESHEVGKSYTQPVGEGPPRNRKEYRIDQARASVPGQDRVGDGHN
jgi:hypothetical protein